MVNKQQTKPVYCLRINATVLEQTRTLAQTENRNLSNYIETVLIKNIDNNWNGELILINGQSRID